MPEPPRILSTSPNGVFIESKATVPTISNLFIYTNYLGSKYKLFSSEICRNFPPNFSFPFQYSSFIRIGIKPYNSPIY